MPKIIFTGNLTPNDSEYGTSDKVRVVQVREHPTVFVIEEQVREDSMGVPVWEHRSSNLYSDALLKIFAETYAELLERRSRGQ